MTLLGIILRGFNKPQFFPPLLQLSKGIRGQISQPPRIQHIKITGIYASVSLHYVLTAANTIHFAGSRVVSGYDVH